MLFRKPKPQSTPNAPRRERRPDGTLYYLAGFSRSGKTTRAVHRLRRARDLFVWDYPKGEWATRYGCTRVSDFAELQRLVLPGSPPGRYAFMRISETPHADFETWCRLVWVAIRARGPAVLVEELSTVTHPGKAPAAWGNICRMGMGFGSDIFALSQRTAEADKTALGNAQVISCGIMGTEDDETCMAKYLRVPLADVRALKQFEYIEFDRRNFEHRRGRVTKAGR